MKTGKILPLLVLMFFALACEENRNSEAETEPATAEIEIQDPEESIKEWNEAWNMNNAKGLKDLLADDAVVVMFGEAMRNEEAEQWIDSTASWMKNLRTTPMIKNKSDLIAYETGEFTHGTIENDTVQMRGTYTMIWERNTAQNEWQVKLVDVSPELELPVQTQ